MNDDQASAWLPLGEAARRLGISVDAVRARARRGLIESRRGNDGKVSVLITGAQAAPEQAPIDDEAPSRLRLDLDEARAEVDHWRTRAHEAELAAARAEEQARLAQAVAVADVATARAEVEARERYITQLEALLREARRPFWRRWLSRS